jgi:hypothetical protein
LASFQPSVGLGSNYKTVTFKNIITKEFNTFEHVSGQVLVIDFWAIW